MTRRGVINAMAECVELAKSHYLTGVGRVSWQHFEDMLVRSGDPALSDGKINRWLGWMQGVLEAQGIITGDQAGEMNLRHRDDKLT